ncbi:TerC/Alx family metal homeostasis membrane protein [Clostridium saccharoperbutylacetonicum]|uniref:TerC/Alx family metal homeostasis membrane protein n=1 Tax=Clostridium saccharoperbutylacetonicum TaxID=36745 RepID=UPI000983C523|nr:TerC/Alx family metal homeostasis membrane protein [Clostridium saccharoperbutylacetonicum]AQR95976.1 inner membrane protein alx [Clostridium saccharoperbutylacetonicum]NSB31843.1 tellurite resistance protein TerC [Clostridium saccharoperbutylacetonicum]
MNTKRNFINLIFWISISILFNIFIYLTRGQTAAVEYFGGYILEMSLSLDNLFLFIMVFSNLGIREEYQERVLLYGVAGAMVLRLIFILLGVNIVNRFHFVLPLFGLILIYSGFAVFKKKNEDKKFNNNFLVKLVKKIIPVTDLFYGQAFFVKQKKRIYATPLFAALIIIEGSDVIFAIDSIPAIFSITTDTFIVYTSNIFAILGLRSMYYVLAKMNTKFRFMKYGVSGILIFTGIKLISLIVKIQISVTNSVLIILSILLLSILLSIIFSNTATNKNKKIYH